MKMLRLLGLGSHALTPQRFQSTGGIIYRFAKKKDKDALLNMHLRYIVDDEHYKGLGGLPSEAAPLMEYTIRDMLRYPYSMIAYDNDRPIAFSMIAIRHRDSPKNRFDKLGPQPPVSNYSYIQRMVNHAETKMWSKYADWKLIGVARTIYVEPNYRRLRVGSTLLETQYDELEKMHRGDKLDAVMSVSTGSTNYKQLEKIGFKKEFEIPDSLYRKDNGESWESTDQYMPRAIVMLKKF